MVQDRLDQEEQAKELLMRMDEAGSDAPGFMENLLVGTPVTMMDRARDVIRQAMGKNSWPVVTQPNGPRGIRRSLP